MSRTIRSFLALMLLASGVTMLAGANPAAAISTRALAQDRAGAPQAQQARSLESIDAPASARKARANKKRVWQTRTITYYEQIPAKWHWSLATAVAKWNTSGARIHFARVSSRQRALLVISYGNTGSSAGRATVGPTRHPWLRLSNAYRTLDATSAYNRVEVMEIFAHELGHVLGFEHTRTRCALMSPLLDIEGCGVITRDKPGYYKCGTINRSLATRLVRSYGGRTRSPGSTWCLIDPMPPALGHVTFSAGESSASPVTIGWAVPQSAPAGSRVEVQTWSSTTCGAPPRWATVSYAPMSAGKWQQHAADSSQDQCFSVALVNRYGVGRLRVAHKVSAPADVAQGTPAAG